MKNIIVILFCLLTCVYAGAQCPAGQTEITIEIANALETKLDGNW